MKKGLLFFVFLAITFFCNGQGVITVQRGANTLFSASLDSAIINAEHGDIIYLPSGVFAVNQAITKKVHIIGMGYHPDTSTATGITAISNMVDFANGSDSSSITGIHGFSSVTINASSISILRCRFETIFWQGIYNNILIRESICGSMQGSVTTGVSGVNVTNNIFYGNISGFNGGASFINNIFLNSSSIGSIYSDVNCIFTNNIFLTGNFFAQNNLFNSNIFVTDSSNTYNINPGSVFSSNVFSVNPSNIFVNLPAGANQWSTQHNYHLTSGSPAIGVAAGGGDAGIYGGNNPWKEGGKPYNPHFRTFNISTGTGTNGMINVDITVEAQDN